MCSGPFKLYGIAEEHIDMIELNHYYDLKGRIVFDQIIFWEKWPSNGKYHVRAWCLADDNSNKFENRRPIYDYQTDLWVVNWNDTDAELRRKLTTSVYKESWTKTDPERDDKKHHNESNRIKLIQRVEKLKVQEPVPEPTGPQ